MDAEAEMMTMTRKVLEAEPKREAKNGEIKKAGTNPAFFIGIMIRAWPA